MKGIHRLVLSCCFLFSNSVWALFELESIRPGVGVDVGFVHQDFNTSFGDGHFRENYPYSNMSMNLRLHRYFGVEAGYQNQFRQQRQQFYASLQPALGFVNPADLDQKLFISEASSHGWNINLLGFWPICERFKTEVMGLAGVARLNMTYYTTVIEDNNAATPVASWESGDETVARFGLGLKQGITPHFGTRLLAIWQKASKLDANYAVPIGQGGDPNPSLPSDFYRVNPKDNYIISLGFFWEL